jgi:hypothetical protein
MCKGGLRAGARPCSAQDRVEAVIFAYENGLQHVPVAGRGQGSRIVTHREGAVARGVSFCRTNLGWTLEEASADDDLHHWAVLRTSDAPDERRFDYYVDF